MYNHLSFIFVHRSNAHLPGTKDTNKYRFRVGHLGREFAYIEQLKLPAIVMVSLPKGKLCLLKDLELNSDSPSDVANDKREDYAKMALMMFYPFRELNDLGVLVNEDSTVDPKREFWPTYKEELDRHLNGQETRFWKTGFDILQNIEDRAMMMQSDYRVRAKDPVQKDTKMKEESKDTGGSKNTIPDVSQLCSDNESLYAESDSDFEECEGKWTHDTLMAKATHITNDRIISARINSQETIIQTDPLEDEVGTEMNEDSYDEHWFRNRDYPTLLKFISGALVDTTKYDDIYMDDDDVNVSEISKKHNIPTLVDVARKVAHVDKMKLDEKQYIAYEIISCTFLIGLVTDGGDCMSELGQSLGTTGISTKEDVDLLVKHLTARGGMEQLIMFLTGPAGAGKSTAVKVAQQFCFEFCQAVAVMWHDRTFFFTACSGSAAALFRGSTTHSGVYLNRKRVLDKAREEWRGKVKVLVVDEISYFSDDNLHKLDKNLKDLNDNQNKPFGGQNIIFSGDFRQFEAIKAKHLLYDRFGSQLWENSINCVIILENIHRFKDDPEYGEMLTRLWRDDLTQEDREKINTRVVGHNGITLPSTFDEDVVYATSTNKERNAIQAGIFRDFILDTHPKVDSPDPPPEHTIIIEAIVNSSNSKKSSFPIGKYTRDRIVHTCGDADCVVNDSKFVDPALRLYVGAHCMCMVDNKHLNDKVPIGNGTLCRVVGIKLSEHAPSVRTQNWDGRRVSTVSAKHVDWVEFEYHPKSKSILKLENEIKELEWELKINQEAYEAFRAKKRARTTTTSRGMMSDPIIQDIMSELNGKKAHLKREQRCRRFKLQPKTVSTVVTYSDYYLADSKTEARCRMTQIPVVLADAITGHKLQGMTIPNVIIASWGYFAKNWPYVVLSRSTTLKGLYLFEPIDMNKSFAPSRDLIEYLRRAEDLQDHILHMRKVRMAEILAKDENNGIVL